MVLRTRIQRKVHVSVKLSVRFTGFTNSNDNDWVKFSVD